MKTLLDNIETKWFLEAIVFRPHTISIILTEAITGEEETIDIEGLEIEGTSPVGVTEDSREFEIQFENIAAHQIIHESFTAWDDYENRDSHEDTIEVLSQSRFLDHLHEYHGWLFDVRKEVRHFRVWTYDAVIEIAATKEPIVRPWKDDI